MTLSLGRKSLNLPKRTWKGELRSSPSALDTTIMSIAGQGENARQHERTAAQGCRVDLTVILQGRVYNLRPSPL